VKRLAPGLGGLEVYFDPSVSIEEEIILSKYVHERPLQHARDVERLRHYLYPKFGTAQAFPMLLVICNSEGEVRWMEVRDWLKPAPPT